MGVTYTVTHAAKMLFHLYYIDLLETIKSTTGQTETVQSVSEVENILELIN